MSPRVPSLLLLAVLIAPAAAQVPGLPLPPPVLDLPYATEDPSQVFDWYPPAHSTGHDPVLIYLHGGKPPAGGKWLITFLHPQALQMYRLNGVAVAAIEFHPWIQYGYPVQKHDGAMAVQFLRAHAAEFGIDPQRLGLWGHSSGGVIGGWLAWGEDERLPTGMLEQQQSSRPDLYLNFASITDFTLLVPQFPAYWFALPKMLHVPPALMQEASATWLLANVRRDFTPPVFSCYGQTLNPPPILDPHDAWFGVALHETMRLQEPEASALSIWEIHDEPSEALDLKTLKWVMQRFEMPEPGLSVHWK
jgi:hypothetical protein